MKRIVTITLIGFISIGLVGCTTQLTKKAKKIETLAEESTIAIAKFAPLRNKNEFTGTGIAQMNLGYDLGLQRDEAIASAKKHIAGQIKTKVDTLLDDLAEENKAYSRNLKSRIHTKISQQVQGAKVKSEWMSKSGNLFVFMAVDRKKIAKKVTDSIKETLKDEGLYLTDEKIKNLENSIRTI